MTIEELRAECEKSEAAMVACPELAGIIVKAKPRQKWHRTYRICKGLSGEVIGGTRDHLNVYIKCTKVRKFLKQFEVSSDE